MAVNHTPILIYGGDKSLQSIKKKKKKKKKKKFICHTFLYINKQMTMTERISKLIDKVIKV